MNVLQQITADIHGIVNLIKSKTLTIKDQQEGTHRTTKNSCFLDTPKSTWTRARLWHSHPSANTSNSRWICVKASTNTEMHTMQPRPRHSRHVCVRQSLDNTSEDIHVWRHTCLKTFYACSWHTSQTNTDQSTDWQIYIISRWRRPYMIYGKKREKGTEGVQYRCIYKEIEGNQRMRWCEHLPTYIWISMVPSSSGHIHGNSKEWRSGEKISSWGTFFPLSFKFNV